MFKYAAVSVIFLVTAVGLFSIPLVLKYKVYTPVSSYIVRGDVVLMSEKYPNLWCEAQELTSSAEFNAYLYENFPTVDESSTNYITSTAQVKLPNKAQEYWGFHLLKGSNISLWACVKLSGAAVTLVHSKTHLRQCLSQYHASFHSDEGSSEELSESESDEATSSISSSQGVISNESAIQFACSTALEHRILASNYRCNSVLKKVRKKFLFSHQVERSGYYYLVFISDTYLDIIPNEFAVKLVMQRTSYSQNSSTTNCTMTTTCELPLSLGSNRRTVVQLPASNGSLQEEQIVSSCKPRKGVYFLFYLGFMLVVFFCAFQ